MRLSFGTVCGYTPFDGAEYDYYTTTKGVLEKVKAHVGDVDFAVQPELVSLLSSRNFGRYADEKGEMKVCFISNNDITGGNSGSAMFNSKGELLGLAFDGNWEAMSSDILYEPKMQRTIGVDVRYILFMIEKYGKAGNLIKELNIINLWAGSRISWGRQLFVSGQNTCISILVIDSSALTVALLSKVQIEGYV